MGKEELLNLLGPQAREAFEGAKRLARAKGGLLSPLHIVAALIEGVSGGDEPARAQRTQLLETANTVLAIRFPDPAQSLTVTKETQAVIISAGRVAEAEGSELVTPLYLLRAALASATARKAFREQPGFEAEATRLLAGALPAS